MWTFRVGLCCKLCKLQDPFLRVSARVILWRYDGAPQGYCTVAVQHCNSVEGISSLSIPCKHALASKYRLSAAHTLMLSCKLSPSHLFANTCSSLQLAIAKTAPALLFPSHLSHRQLAPVILRLCDLATLSDAQFCKPFIPIDSSYQQHTYRYMLTHKHDWGRGGGVCKFKESSSQLPVSGRKDSIIFSARLELEDFLKNF